MTGVRRVYALHGRQLHTMPMQHAKLTWLHSSDVRAERFGLSLSDYRRVQAESHYIFHLAAYTPGTARCASR